MYTYINLEGKETEHNFGILFITNNKTSAHILNIFNFCLLISTGRHIITLDAKRQM
jgi:hypothetical protein